MTASTSTTASTSGWKSTACILCECNCGISVQLGGPDGRRLLRVRGVSPAANRRTRPVTRWSPLGRGATRAARPPRASSPATAVRTKPRSSST